jgi:hypothetical protein
MLKGGRERGLRMRGRETSPGFTIHHSIHIGIKYICIVGRKERFDIPLIIGAHSYFRAQTSHIALLSKVTIKPAGHKYGVVNNQI